MRSKLLNKKNKSRLVKMLIMAGYVILYYVTNHIADVESAKNIQGLAKLIQVMNGG